MWIIAEIEGLARLFFTKTKNSILIIKWNNDASELNYLMINENYLLYFGAMFRISKLLFFRFFIAEVTYTNNNVSTNVFEV